MVGVEGFGEGVSRRAYRPEPVPASICWHAQALRPFLHGHMPNVPSAVTDSEKGFGLRTLEPTDPVDPLHHQLFHGLLERARYRWELNTSIFCP